MTSKPRKAKTQQNCEAWWYEMPNRIDIFIHIIPNGPTVVASIERRQLRGFFSRALGKQP